MLTAYVDSDHAGDLDTGYSTTGVVLYFAGGPVDWMSTKQTVVAIFDGRSRIRRHVKSVLDGDSFSELVHVDQSAAGAGDKHL